MEVLGVGGAAAWWAHAWAGQGCGACRGAAGLPHGRGAAPALQADECQVRVLTATPAGSAPLAAPPRRWGTRSSPPTRAAWPCPCTAAASPARPPTRCARGASKGGARAAAGRGACRATPRTTADPAPCTPSHTPPQLAPATLCGNQPRSAWCMRTPRATRWRTWPPCWPTSRSGIPRWAAWPRAPSPPTTSAPAWSACARASASSHWPTCGTSRRCA